LIHQAELSAQLLCGSTWKLTATLSTIPFWTFLKQRIADSAYFCIFAAPTIPELLQITKNGRVLVTIPALSW
jgi:hypothetical protein